MLVELIWASNLDARQVDFSLKELTLDPQISKFRGNLAQVAMQILRAAHDLNANHDANVCFNCHVGFDCNVGFTR